MAVDDVAVVYEWRLQAERMMRAAGKPSLTDDQVADFVSRYMPAYETYLPRLYSEGPQRRPGIDANCLKVKLPIPISIAIVWSQNEIYSFFFPPNL